MQLIQVFARELRLRKALAAIRDSFDYVFIDCPPSLSLLTVNALCAADSVIVPMQCEYFALEGIASLTETIRELRSAVNPDLEIEGVLRTMCDNRSKLASLVSDELRKYFGEKVYSTIIPRNIKLAEAPSHGQPVMYYDRNSPGSKAYLALAGEILRKEAQDGIAAAAEPESSAS